MGFSVRKRGIIVTLPRATAVIAVGNLHQNGSKSCQASFGPSSVFFCPAYGSKKPVFGYQSLQLGIIAWSRMMLHKNYLS